MADGPAEEVLTDEPTLSRCALSMPQVPTILKGLPELRVRYNVLGVDEAVDEILRALEKGRRGEA